MKAKIAGLARRTVFTLLTAAIFFSFSCGSDTPSSINDGAAQTTAEPGTASAAVAEVVITVDKEKIPSSGSEAVYITAAAKDADGKDVSGAEIEYYSQGEVLEGPAFYSAEPGFYNLYAYCNGIRSNVIEVQVVDYSAAAATCLLIRVALPECDEAAQHKSAAMDNGDQRKAGRGGDNSIAMTSIVQM